MPQANTEISVKIFCEQIRKIARRKANYCFIRHSSCFAFNPITDSKLFQVLNQKGRRYIRIYNDVDAEVDADISLTRKNESLSHTTYKQSVKM